MWYLPNWPLLEGNSGQSLPGSHFLLFAGKECSCSWNAPWHILSSLKDFWLPIEEALHKSQKNVSLTMVIQRSLPLHEAQPNINRNSTIGQHIEIQYKNKIKDTLYRFLIIGSLSCGNYLPVSPLWRENPFTADL